MWLHGHGGLRFNIQRCHNSIHVQQWCSRASVHSALLPQWPFLLYDFVSVNSILLCTGNSCSRWPVLVFPQILR